MLYSTGKTKPKMTTTGMSLKSLNGLPSMSSSTWLYPLSETSMASRDTMTTRMFTSLCTNSTSKQVNGLSLTRTSCALTSGSTRWEECISSTRLVLSMVLTPQLRLFLLAFPTLKSLSEAECGLSLTEQVPLQVLGKKDLGTQLTAFNTKCSHPVIFPAFLWLMKAPSM